MSASAAPLLGAIPVDQRRRIERRRQHRPFHLHALHGRRLGPRRRSDADLPLRPADVYSPHLWFITLGVLILCIADAHNTLLLVQAGMSELNPLMQQLIHQGPWHFILGKFALTSMGMLLLVAYEHRPLGKRLRVIHLIYVIFLLYVGLIIYQSMLMPTDLPGIVWRT